MAETFWKVDDRQWQIGLKALYPACREASRVALKRAVDRGFEVSQELVHVDTGRNKASGRIVEASTADEINFDVIYGGDEYEVDYAGWLEIFYPYLAPGMEQGMASWRSEPDLLKGPFGR